MADAGVFMGCGDIRPGRTASSSTVFAEALEYQPAFQAAGEIEGFETVILRAHGGDLGGFFLLRADPERPGRLSMSPESVRLIRRADAVVEGLGAVAVNLDAAAGRLVGESHEATADLI
jgi:hypothetical protein